MSFGSSLKSVTDTTLWKQLDTGYTGSSDEDVAKELAVNVKSVCAEAESRIKHFPFYHSEFTLHDTLHMIRVTELMSLDSYP